MDFTIITLILNIVFIVFLVIGILFGLKRGIKRAGLRLAIFLVSMLIAGLVTPLISHLIMSIQLTIEGEVLSLNDYLIEMISSSPEIEQVLTDIPSLESLIVQLPLVFANLIIFLILVYVVGFVGYICYTITSHILFKKKKIVNPEYTLKNNKPVLIENNTKEKKHRILGGLVGGLQGVLLLFFTLVPVSGVVKTFNQLIKEPVAAEEVAGDTEQLPENIAVLIKTYLPQEALDVLDAYNNSIYAKIDNVLPLTDVCFDSISTIKVNGEKIVFREEIKTVAEIYNNVAFLMNLDLSSSIETLDFDKIERAIELVFNIKTFKAIAPELIPYILNQLKVEDTSGDYAAALNVFIDGMVAYFEAEPDVAETLKSDLISIVRIAKVCVQSGLVTEFQKDPIDEEKVIEIIKGQDGEYNTPKQVISNFFNSKTIKQLLAEGCNFALTELENILKTMMPETVDLDTVTIGRVESTKINWESVSNSFLDMFKSAFEIYEEVKDIETEEEDFNVILSQCDYKKVLLNAANVIDKIKELPIFSATSNNTNIYNNIMVQLNKTEIGKYIDFTKSSTNAFWVSNMTPVANLLEFEQSVYDIFKDVNEETTEYQPLLDEIDFDKLQEVLDSFYDSALLTMVRDDAVATFKAEFIDDNPDIDYSEFETKIMVNLLTNLSNDENIVEELKTAIQSSFNISKAIVKSGLVDEFTTENVDFNSVVSKLKNKDDQDKTLFDVFAENVFSTTTLKTLFVEMFNFTLETLEETIVAEGYKTECDLGRLDYASIDWSVTQTELKQFFNDLLDFELLEENAEIGDASIPVDMASFIKAIGKAIQDLRDLSIFDISETENVFDNIINSVKDIEEVATYVDLSILLEDNAIETEFSLLAEIVDNLFDSKVISYFTSETELGVQDFINMSKDLTEKVDVDGTEKTRISLILEPLFESKFVKNLLTTLFEEIDASLQEQVVEISEMVNGEGGELVEVSNLNINAINDENEHAKIIATFENLFKFIASLDGNLVENDVNMETFVNSDLSIFGTFLDSISNLELFAPVAESGQKGLYNNIIDWLDSYLNNSLDGLVDLSVAQENGFTWNAEFTTIQPSLKAMFTIEIEVEGDNGKETVKLFYGLNDLNNILTINPEISEGKETSEVHDLLEGILASNIFKKISGMLVDTVNDIVENLANVAPENAAPAFEDYSLVKEQRFEIIKIFENYIKANNAGVFNKLNDMASLTDAEIELLGNLLNSFKENAYRTENTGVTNEGVFKHAYDNLLNAFNGFSDLVNTFESPLDVDWVSVIKLGIQLKSVEEFNASTLDTVKDSVVEVIKAVNPETDIAEIEEKLDNVVSSLETLDGSDLSNLETNVESVLENFADAVELVELLDNVGVVIQVADEVNITSEQVVEKIDGLNIDESLKSSLKNIFGVA